MGISKVGESTGIRQSPKRGWDKSNKGGGLRENEGEAQGAAKRQQRGIGLRQECSDAKSGRWRLDAALARSMAKASQQDSTLQTLGERLFEQAVGCSDRADAVFEFSDGRRPFRGHSCVLIAMCDEYERLFRDGTMEKKEGVVQVPGGISEASFLGFLEFLYLGVCGECCGKADGRELAVLSEMYHVRGLREWLLEDGVGVENLCVAYEFGLADQGVRSDVVSRCQELAREGLGEIGGDCLQGAKASVVKGLLRSRVGAGGGASRARVAEGFEFVLRWVKASGGLTAGVKGAAEGIVGALDLGKLSRRYLSKVVKLSGLLSGERYAEVCGKWVASFNREFDAERFFGDLGRGDGQFRRIWNVATHGAGQEQRVAGVDYDLGRVLIFNVDSGACEASAGSKGQGPGQMDMPACAAFNSRGELFVSDLTLHRIQVFDRAGRFLRAFGSRGSAEGQLDGPHGLAFTADDELAVVDNRNHRVQIFRGDGTFVRALGSNGGSDGLLERPVGVCVGPEGHVYVADAGNHRVQVFDIGGAFVKSYGGGEGCGPGQFMRPLLVGVGPAGDVLVADVERQNVQVFLKDGTHVQTIDGTHVAACGGMCLDQEGRVFIVCRETGRIVMFS